ncbi:Oxygen tolerance [Marinobacter sp. es.048]|uniref:BatD family protein n=1 Tax=Marinobacter sp. es.048 TaxID=1761795 RepID=UPI000B5893A9|nr:BatD family protein [Marinobacter sp. es.048]SNC67314.1 Oxygen tolerance [Marinobacter sp. es.048]
MVKRLMIPAICLFLLTALWLPAQAQTHTQARQLTVEPDRTRLYEGEVLTLTVKGSMEIDINLGNLFDFDMSSLPKPDIEKVEPDFEILAQNQQYSIRTVNSQMVGEITWTYQLAPKTTGELTIPALNFKDAVSEPVTVEVLDGSPPDQAATGRDSFIELSADKDEVYVQEQLILTVRLFFRGNLIRGELSEPTHPHVIIESLGRQQEFSRYRDGVRYRVVERRYAIFPQRPGTLNLPPVRFEGQARDASGSLRFLRDSEELFEVPVKDVPSQFSGDTWLPATGLSLEESGLPPSLEVATGENITREIRLTAAGLPGEALPPLPDTVPDGLRSYPEEPERQTETTPAGLTSSLKQSVALVPVEAGQMTLPAIRIYWWDTEADRERVAVIPEKTLTVKDPHAVAAAAPPQTDQGSSDREPDAANIEPSIEPAADETGLWQWLSLLLGILWAGTLLAWWWSGKGRKVTSEQTDKRDEDAAFDRLAKAARDGAAMTPELVVEWANLHSPGHGFRSASDVVDHFGDETLATELRRLQARLFAPRHEHDAWDGRPLARALEHIRKRTPDKTMADLPPLYPEGLS